MDYSTFIAKRYLSTSSNKGFYSWVSRLSVAGVIVGVAVLIVVVAVVVGFEKEFRDRFLAANAHILIFKYPSGIDNHLEISNLLKDRYKSEIKEISPFIHFETLAIGSEASHAALVRGINPNLREKMQSFKKYIQPEGALNYLQGEIDLKASVNTPRAIVGKGLARYLNLKVGDLFSIANVHNSAYSGDSNFEVVGIYNSGFNYYDDKLVIVSLSASQSLVGSTKSVTGLEIGLNNPGDSIRISEELSNLIDASITPWQNFNQQMFEMLNKERSIIIFIVFLVCIVASFNVLTTLFISVTLKQKDISILKALGATRRDIKKIFLKQGLLIGILGSFGGLLIGVVFCALLQNFTIIDLPDQYLIEKLPISYVWNYFFIIIFSSALICTLAGIYPAMIASRVQPADGFRMLKN